MSCEEQQQEEIEVLDSIYDGDDNFKKVNDNTFQYKVGEDSHHRSFVVEVQWGPNYPDQLPSININAFYNKHVLTEIKESIVEKLKSQAEELLGYAMTYSVFEFAKENGEEMMQDQPDAITATEREDKANGDRQEDIQAKTKVKKEQLTKSQKRKIVNRLDNKGELPRGHDWIDVVKHLSQSGRAEYT